MTYPSEKTFSPTRNASLSLRSPKLIVGEVGRFHGEKMIRLVWKFAAPMTIAGQVFNGAMIECTRQEARAYYEAIGDKLGITQ